MKITYIFIGLLACALGVGIAQYIMPNADPAHEFSGSGSTTGQVIPDKLGGNFTLMQADKPVELSDFQDKLVVMYFGFASCPDVCPTTLTVIASALRKLTPEELENVQRRTRTAITVTKESKQTRPGIIWFTITHSSRTPI